MVQSFSLNMLWGCLNAIQLMVKLPLLKTIKYPASAQIFNNKMVKIATFDFLSEFDNMGIDLYTYIGLEFPDLSFEVD